MRNQTRGQEEGEEVGLDQDCDVSLFSFSSLCLFSFSSLEDHPHHFHVVSAKEWNQRVNEQVTNGAMNRTLD